MAAEGDVVADNAAGNAVGRHGILNRCLGSFFVLPAWTIVAAVEDSQGKRSLLPFVQANPGRDNAEGHIPVNIITNTKVRNH